MNVGPIIAAVAVTNETADDVGLDLNGVAEECFQKKKYIRR